MTAPAAAPSAASAPEAPFPGSRAAQVGAPVGAPPAVSAPERVGSVPVSVMVDLCLALGHRLGS